VKSYENEVRSCKTDVASYHAHAGEPLPSFVEASKCDFLEAGRFGLLNAKDDHVACECRNEPTEED
jgi:hypothetical protein